MTCTHPVFLEKENMRVPCGYCVNCKVAHSREWATRILHEASMHDDSIFLTLTFNDDYLPQSLSINKVDLQLFFKRLRKRLNKSIKYFACGEYGDTNHRPHYHAIVCGLSYNDKPLVDAAWPYGFNYIGTVTYDSCRYVTEYVQKKYTKAYSKQVYGDRQQPFLLVSKGLGKDFLFANEKQLRHNLGVTVKGHDVGLPLYYKRKLELTDEEKEVVHVEAMLRIKEKLEAKGISDDSMYGAMLNQNWQKERNVVAKAKMRNRKF